MNQLLQYQLWIGVGFTSFLIVFLMIAFFKGGELTIQQAQILRFFSALCAGFAGAAFVGEATVTVNQTIGQGGKLVATGTAGFALFFIVWFTFKAALPQLRSGVHFRVPDNWSFKHTIDALVSTVGAVAAYKGFETTHLSAPLRSGEIRAKTMAQAISRIRLLAEAAIPDYDVTEGEGEYTLTVRLQS
jgi:hypothetical protein